MEFEDLYNREYFLITAENQKHILPGIKELIMKKSVKEVDQLLSPIVSEVTKAVDCTKCGFCCQVQEPGISYEEIERLAKLNNQPISNFKDEHVAWEKCGNAFLCSKPCVFLNDKKCRIYEDRPQSCKDYPGLERPHIKWRWKQVEENFFICPIVFTMIHQMHSRFINLKSTIK